MNTKFINFNQIKFRMWKQFFLKIFTSLKSPVLHFFLKKTGEGYSKLKYYHLIKFLNDTIYLKIFDQSLKIVQNIFLDIFMIISIKTKLSFILLFHFPFSSYPWCHMFFSNELEWKDATTLVACFQPLFQQNLKNMCILFSSIFIHFQ